MDSEGIVMGFAVDITNQRFNRLKAISFSYKGHSRSHYWLFECDCGNQKIMRKSHVVGNKTLSCGCYSQDRKDKMKECATHRNDIYPIWSAMKARCSNKNNPYYHRYGGRGIKICDRWLKSFPNFLEDMGARPSEKHSIDRIDNDGNYNLSNCRWATSKEQSRNKSTNRIFKVNGVEKCVTDLASDYKVNHFLVFLRLRRGWDIERALEIKAI